MILRLSALIPWMVLAGSVTAQVRPAEVLYLQQDGISTSAYRVGEECFVPLEQITHWGWKAGVQGNTANLLVDGKTLSVPTRQISGKLSIPLRAVVTELGAESEWQPTTDTLSVFVHLEKAKVESTLVELVLPLPVKPVISRLTSPNRLVLDLPGARLGPKSGLELPANARAFQHRQNVVRVVVETGFVPEIPSLEAKANLLVPVKQDESVADVANIAPIEPLPILPSNPAPAKASRVITPELRAISAGRLQLTLKASAGLPRPATVNKPDPSTIEVVLPGVVATLPEGFLTQNEAVSLIEVRTEPKQSVITVHLSLPMGAELSSQASGVSLVLSRPGNVNGKLAGKTIVVDPGHGGTDSGATSGGFREKDLTMIVSKALSRKLADAGATVVLTRQQDVYVPLLERNRISERNRADLFVSVHINSTGGRATTSGGIAFFHQQDWVSKLMAECIQHEVGKVAGVPNLGVWSDRRIHKSGFSVLRNSAIPAVLLELGFINHPRDRARLVQPQFAGKVADAIVTGLRAFLGEKSDAVKKAPGNLPLDPLAKPATTPPVTAPGADPASVGSGD